MVDMGLGVQGLDCKCRNVSSAIDGDHFLIVVFAHRHADRRPLFEIRQVAFIAVASHGRVFGNCIMVIVTLSAGTCQFVTRDLDDFSIAASVGVLAGWARIHINFLVALGKKMSPCFHASTGVGKSRDHFFVNKSVAMPDVWEYRWISETDMVDRTRAAITRRHLSVAASGSLC